MAFANMHPEDVKAAIRKRFRSVADFERTKGLPAKSVSDLLRGYKSARVARAVEDAINSPLPGNSEHSGDSTAGGALHRLNARAR